MDYRRLADCESALLASPSTVLTPQLEDFELFHGYREYLQIAYCKRKQPFMLVLNLASVLESELIVLRKVEDDKVVLQVHVVHLWKEMQGVVPFTRDCTYRYILPDHVSDEPLSALWTDDHHLIVVESSNLMKTEDIQDIDTSATNADETLIVPRKVNAVYSPSANADVLRHSMALLEREISKTRKYVQHGSFVRPDINRPPPDFKKIDKSTDELLNKNQELSLGCVENIENMLQVAEGQASLE